MQDLLYDYSKSRAATLIFWITGCCSLDWFRLTGFNCLVYSTCHWKGLCPSCYSDTQEPPILYYSSMNHSRSSSCHSCFKWLKLNKCKLIQVPKKISAVRIVWASGESLELTLYVMTDMSDMTYSFAISFSLKLLCVG